MVDRSDVDALLDRVLERSGARETEVLYLAQDAALTRFATNHIHQNVREHDASVQVRLVSDQRVGVASTNRLDDAGIADVVARATTICERAAPNPRIGHLPPRPEAPPAEVGFVAATAEATAEQRAEGARLVIAAGVAEGLQASGSFATSVLDMAVANSNGVRSRSRTTRAGLVTVMMDGFASGAASGYAHAGSTDVAEIDADALGREAAEKGARMRGAGELEPGEYEVVLEEYAVAGLLEYLSFVGFSALALEEGRSFMEIGKRVTGDRITVWDDGADPAGLPSPIDFEGVPRRHVSLIRNGVAEGVVHDAATAHRAGTASTGHALPAPNPWGPQATNLFMAPGDGSKEEMLRSMKRGIWVTRFHYINPVHPKKAILTGMTKDGTFLVEDGAFSRPLLNFRFTQSVPEAFDSVISISRETKLLPGEFFGGSRVPALHLGRFNFTGVTAREGAA